MRKSNRGCLSQLLFIAAFVFVCYAVYSHCSDDATPIAWRTTGIALAWMLGLAVFFKLISPRRQKDTAPDFTVTVETVNRGSDDISASARQLEYIKALGGKPKKNMTLSEAPALIDKLKIERDVEQRREVERRLKLKNGQS